MAERKETAYFRDIGMSRTAIKRAEEVISAITELYPADHVNVFVSDAVDSEGNRTYRSVWVVTDEYASEAKNFLTQTNFDYAKLDWSSGYIDVLYHSFVPGQWSDESRMRVDVRFFTFGMEFRAVRNNCQYLYQLISTGLREKGWFRTHR